MNISSISEIIKPTFEGHLKKAQEQLCYLTTPKGEKSLKNPYLICDICGDAHEVDECYSNGAHEQILATIGKSQTQTPKSNAPTFSITTSAGTTTRGPLYLTTSNSTTVDNTKRTIKEEGPDDEETTTT
ncbi:hypothetical protein Tco_1471776 [Tanacetum coccineum]